MRILLVTPTPSGRVDGNLITAQRWGEILRCLGNVVEIEQNFRGQPADCLVAIHALKSYASVTAFDQAEPQRPIVVCLSGTDLYRDLDEHPRALESLEKADRLVVLQPKALDALPQRFHPKARIIYQSANGIERVSTAPQDSFRVVVIGHLREEKDPFRTAMAVRKLPPTSRIEVTHIGSALNEEMEQMALSEAAGNPRYRWLGALTHEETLKRLAGSHLLAITSRMEGSSNVLSEALVSSVPVVASAIPGLIGTLGEDYPGLFPLGDTKALAALLERAESDRDFYQRLQKEAARLRPLVDRARERESWRKLLEEIL